MCDVCFEGCTTNDLSAGCPHRTRRSRRAGDGMWLLTGPVLVALSKAALNNPPLLVLKPLGPVRFAAAHGSGGDGEALPSSEDSGATRFMNVRAATADGGGAATSLGAALSRNVGWPAGNSQNRQTLRSGGDLGVWMPLSRVGPSRGRGLSRTRWSVELWSWMMACGVHTALEHSSFRMQRDVNCKFGSVRPHSCCGSLDGTCRRRGSWYRYTVTFLYGYKIQNTTDDQLQLFSLYQRWKNEEHTQYMSTSTLNKSKIRRLSCHQAVHALKPGRHPPESPSNMKPPRSQPMSLHLTTLKREKRQINARSHGLDGLIISFLPQPIS